MPELVLYMHKLVKLFLGFDPEVLTLSDEQIWGYFEKQPKLAVYRHYIQNILDERPHVLSMEQEALLAGASEILVPQVIHFQF